MNGDINSSLDLESEIREEEDLNKAKNKVKNDNREDLPRFRNIDVLGNYNINRNFRVFFKIRNIFNREYAGLNAYETFDDLIYNPQELRTFRLGMSYRID